MNGWEKVYYNEVSLGGDQSDQFDQLKQGGKNAMVETGYFEFFKLAPPKVVSVQP